MKLTHRQRIVSKTIKFISKSILLSFLSILLKTIQPIGAGPKANQSCGAEMSSPFFFQVNRPTPFVSLSWIIWCWHLADQLVYYIIFSTSSLPAIRRGDVFNCYFPTTDNKLIEYDFDELVYEAQSPYQNIKIYHSLQFGNMLVLDNDPSKESSHKFAKITIIL